MLRISIHAGARDNASPFNLLAWLDIGYDKLGPLANYKTVLYQSGRGVTLPAPIDQYPRWSASLWDLTARALAIGLREAPENLTEEVPVVVTGKRIAFAAQLCALIEHVPGADQQHRRTLATMALSQVGKKRGTYTAVFDEHTMPVRTTDPFIFHPAFLRPAELVLHACLMLLSGKAELPTRPSLCFPDLIEAAGEKYVPIHRLVEPAKTGFVRWLTYNDVSVTQHPNAPLGMALAGMYIQFLTAVV